MSDEDLYEAQATLMEARDRYRSLRILDADDINYQDPDVFNVDVKKNEIEVSVQLAEVNRLLALSQTNPAQREENYKAVVEELEVVLSLSQDADIGSPLLEAKVLLQMGLLYQSHKNYPAADHYYNRALQIHQRNKNSRGVSQVRIVMEAADMEKDQVGTLLKRMRKLAEQGNKEEHQLRDTFDKFDVDRSGHLDSQEFSSLASELGTYPPLTEEELDEALLQIDQGDDNEFSFEELWMWWISDKIDDPHM
jgi:Ca2+-binding EF-hand superfamily protein